MKSTQLKVMIITTSSSDRPSQIVFCIISYFALMLIGSGAQAGMVLEYRLNAGQGVSVVDTSGNQIDSTLSIGSDYTPPDWGDGYSSAGLQFNGTSDLLWIDDQPSLDIPHFTMMAWINYEPSPIPSERRLEVLEKAGAYWMNIRMDTRKLRVGGIFGIDHEWAFLDTASAIPEGSWTHVAGTYDGITMKTYVNGNLSSTKGVTKDVVSNDQPLIIGAKYQVTNNPDPANDPPGVNRPGALFNGTIDEVRVFDAALSQNQISSYMNTLILPGDFNADGIIDQGDYVAWRDSFAQSVLQGSGADGNNNGLIDAADYTIWRDASAAVSISVPEPDSWLLFAVGLTTYLAQRRGYNKLGCGDAQDPCCFV